MLNVETVEENLIQILDIAHSWRAIVLMDEADIYLAKRISSAADPTRNVITGIFLRLLNYNKGVLFLTTNHVTALDDAFRSRISMFIRYHPLTLSQRVKVWVTLLSGVGLCDADLEMLAAHELDGHQIHNCIQIAQTWATSCKEPLSTQHVLKVLNMFHESYNDLRDALLKSRGRKIIWSPPRRWPVRSLVPRELLFSAALVTVFVLLMGVVSLLPRWVFLSFWMLSLLPYPGEYFCVFCAFGCCLCHPGEYFCVFLCFWVLSLYCPGECFFALLGAVFATLVSIFVFLGFVSLQPGWVLFALLGAVFGTLVSFFVFWGCCLSRRHSALSSCTFFAFPFWIMDVFFLWILFNLKWFHHHHH